ncbi:MAG: elongation factor G [Alphaproteobacteria bacterium]
MTQKGKAGARAIAIIGPYLSGKTALLESILCTTGKIHRKAGQSGRIFGDSSAEAKTQEMGIEVNAAFTDFMDNRFYFLDCPGSLEFLQETVDVLPGVDAAVVVIEPELDKVKGIAPILKLLDQQNLPHIIFVNKIERFPGSVRALAKALNEVSDHPVVLRHLPIRDGEEVKGYIDLAAQRAYSYENEKQSKQIDLPDDGRIEDARYSLLETLADFDDHLMEELLEDIDPPKEEVMEDLSKDLSANLVVPMMIGSAIHDNGTFRLLKALRHEIPGVEATVKRRGVEGSGFVGQALKIYHTEHGGMRTLARVFQGSIKDGEHVNGERIAGLFYMNGEEMVKTMNVGQGDIAAFGRLESVKTGDTLSLDGKAKLSSPAAFPPVYEMKIEALNRGDEMRLSESLTKICDEDPSITYEHRESTHELVLKGQGEVQLRTAVNKLKSKYNIDVGMSRPQVPYQETIQKPVSQHTRYKKQSGGHGQFGDVVVEIAPQGRGEGFSFVDKIKGGVIPKTYIPSVEHGVKDYLVRGPLGFPVVDLGVVLVDGKFHAVDSSDMAFQTAGRQAMAEALPKCAPVLLEPIVHIHIHIPNDYTNKVTGMISQRRGQMLGYDARENWGGWDTVEAHMPLAEIHDLIIELRSMSQGAGTYTFEHHHMQELTGRMAELVLEARKAAQEG